jgi:hypothetical protein
MKKIFIILVLVSVMVMNSAFAYSNNKFEDGKIYTVIDEILPSHLGCSNLDSGIYISNYLYPQHITIDVATAHKYSNYQLEIWINNDNDYPTLYAEPLLYKLHSYFGGQIGTNIANEENTYMQQKLKIDPDGDDIFEEITYWEALQRGMWYSNNNYNNIVLYFVHYNPGQAKSMFPYKKAPIEDIFGPNPTESEIWKYNNEFPDWPYTVRCLFGPGTTSEFDSNQYSSQIDTTSKFNFNAILN